MGYTQDFGCLQGDRVQVLFYTASFTSFPSHCHFYLLPLHYGSFSVRLPRQQFSLTQISLVPKRLFSDSYLNILRILRYMHFASPKWGGMKISSLFSKINADRKYLWVNACISFQSNLLVKKMANPLVFCILISWPHNVIYNVVNRALKFVTQRSLSSHRSMMICQIGFIYWQQEIPKIEQRIIK